MRPSSVQLNDSQRKPARRPQTPRPTHVTHVVKLAAQLGTVEAPPALSERQVHTTMRASVQEGAAFSAMAGFGSAFLNAFAIALGASATGVAWLNSLPVLLSSVGQEFGAWLSWHVRSPKRTVLIGSFIQALLWLPLAALAFWPFVPSSTAVDLVIVLACLIALADSVFRPAWTELMGAVVPQAVRGAYFTHRARIAQLVLFLATLLGGFLLEKTAGWPGAAGFGILFSFAFAARMMGNQYFRRHADVPHRAEYAFHPGPLAFARQVRHTPLGSFLSFQALFSFAVNVAAPFFALYMLRDLQLDYISFALIGASEIAAKLVSLPVWGRVMDRYGSRHVLRSTALLIPLVPVFWLAPSPSVAWLVLAGVFSGFVWAGFDSATFTYLLDATTRENRASAAAHSTMFIGLTTFAGATIGGVLAQLVATPTGGLVLFGIAGLPLVFGLSALLRAAASLSLAGRLKEVRPQVHIVDETRFLWRVVTRFPLLGVQHELHNSQATAHEIARVVARRAVWMKDTFNPARVIERSKRRPSRNA